MIAICDRPPAASDWSIRSQQNPVTGDLPQAPAPYKRLMRKLLEGPVGKIPSSMEEMQLSFLDAVRFDPFPSIPYVPA